MNSLIRKEVYKCIYNHGYITGSQTKKILNKSNQLSESVRNRITELKDMGLVEELGTVLCEYTNRQVLLFDVTDRKVPLPIPMKLTKEQKKAKVQNLIADLKVEVLDKSKRVTRTDISVELDTIFNQVGIYE